MARRARREDALQLLSRELGAVPIALIIRGVTVWEKVPRTACVTGADPVDSEHKDEGERPRTPGQKEDQP